MRPNVEDVHHVICFMTPCDWLLTSRTNILLSYWGNTG
jgi:hypothetical protein